MAARGVARSPGFSAGLVVLLGVGIAAATAVTSVASAYLLRPDTWHYNGYTRFLTPLRGDNPVYLARLRIR